MNTATGPLLASIASASVAARVLGLGALLLVTPANASAADGASLLASFPFGNQVGNLAIARSDGLTDAAQLAGVNGDGVVFIRDDRRHKITRLFVETGVVAELGEIEVGGKMLRPNGILPLDAGRFVLTYSDGHLRILRVLDGAGQVVAERQISAGGGLYLLPNGNFGLSEPRIGTLDTIVQEYDVNLVPGGHGKLKSFFGTVTALRSGARVVLNGQCWAVGNGSGLGISDIESFRLFGDSILTTTDGDLKVARPDRTVTVYTLPPNVDTGPEDYRRIWYKLNNVVGLDGNFYSLIETPDHYEVVRWNLSELPSRTIPPPSGPAPAFSVPDEVTAKVGVKLALTVTASTSDGQDPTYSAQGVPSGAIYYPEAATSSVFVWTPTPPDVGSHQVTFKAEDHMCKSSTKVVTVRVVE